jgi:hypothetical protein
MNKADFIFLPFYLEKKSKQKTAGRQYCYYTQFSSGLTSTIGELDRIVSLPYQGIFEFPWQWSGESRCVLRRIIDGRYFHEIARQ